MKISKLKRIAVIESVNPDIFEHLFNSKLDELAFMEELDYQIYCDSKYKAIISYSETVREMDCVKDEFHAEGIRYVCANCPDLVDPLDARIKYCECKYAELGRTHKDHEACEYFYRRLKAGLIEPRKGVR